MNKIKYTKIFFLVNLFFCIMIFGNLEMVSAETYHLVKVNKDGTRQDLKKSTNDLKNAIAQMNKLETDLSSMPSIAEGSVNGEIINTKYGLVKIAGYQYVYDTANTGSIRTYINSNGNRDYDGAFLGEMDNGRIKTLLSGNRGWISIHLKNVAESNYSEILPLSRVTSPSHYKISDGELKHYYSRDMTSKTAMGGIYASNIIGKAPSGIKDGTYYSYDGIYFYKNLIDLLDDAKESKTGRAVNKDKPYYNYYQYVGFRSRTKITATDMKNYIKSKKISNSVLEDTTQHFITHGNATTVNPAYLFAMACHESAYGTSQIAHNKNNLFGISVFDSDSGSGTVFKSVEECIKTASKYILSLGYADATGDSRYFGAFLGNKGSGMNVKYASDPYWGEIIAARYYALDKYTKFKDYNSQIIGIKQDADPINVRKDPRVTSGNVVYQMKNNRANLKVANMSVNIVNAVIGQEIDGNNIWYKIKSDTILDKNKNTMDLFAITNIPYDYNNSDLYVHSSNIRKANQEIKCIHVFGEYKVTKKATCEATGEKTKTCLECGLTEKEEIPKLNHDLEEKTVKQATCTEDGQIEEKCKLCNKVIESKKINKLGHDFEKWEIVKQPTLTEKGQKKSKCTRCSHIEYVDIAPLKELTTKDGLQHIEKFKYNNQTCKLELQGFLAIKGIDNLISKEYYIEFVNQKTNESVSFKLNAQTSGYPFEVPKEAGKSFKYSWYKSELDINTLPQGDYIAYIKAIQGEYVAREKLTNMFSKKITKKGIQGTRGYTFITNYFTKDIPIEISVRNNGLISLKEPPQDISMFNTMYTIDFENDKLRIKGTSFNAGASYSSKDNVKRTIVIENIDTYARYTYNASYISKVPYVVTLPVPDKLSKERAWFDETLDVSKLPKGTYVIHIRTCTNKVDDSSELNDIFMTDLSKKNCTIDGKEYSLKINSNKKYRIELNID